MPLSNLHEISSTNARYDSSTGGMIEVIDTMTNFVTNLGVQGKDKGRASSFSELLISEQELTAIYKQGGIGGKIIDCVAEDLGRVWRTLSLKDGDIDPLKDFYKQINLRMSIVNMKRWSRLYGSAVMILEIEGDDPQDELVLETISPSKPLSGLRIEHRHDLATVDTDLVTGRPLSYQVSRTGEVFHPSRIVGPMDGIQMPVSVMRRNGGWGESVLGRAYNSLLTEETTAHALNHIVSEAKTDVIGVKDLSQFFDGGSKQSKFEQRWHMANQMKGLLNLLLIDDGMETFQTASNATTISGLGPVLQQLANRISAIVDIPMTRLYGSLASGLSTSGATNQQDYYDMLSAQREMSIDPLLRFIDVLGMLSVYGSVQPGFGYTWKPFRELSVPEQADVDNKDAMTAQTYINAGVVVPGHVAKRVKENGTFPIGEDFVGYLEERDGIQEGQDAGSGGDDGSRPTLGEENEGKENETRILLEIAEAVKSGKVEADQAVAILEITFPDLDPNQLRAIVTAEVKEPQPPPAIGQPPVPPGQPQEPLPEEDE